MKKQPKKLSKLEKIDARNQELQKKLLIAHSTGMSETIIQQLRALIEENQREMADEFEMERFRREQKDNDDDSFIV
jgi:hypothetical protein